MSKTPLLAMLLSFAALSACNYTVRPMNLAPFDSRPADTFLFTHDVRVIEGTVWIFEKDGNYFGHDIPAFVRTDDGQLAHQFVPSPRIILDSNTYVVTMDAKLFDLASLSDLKALELSTITDLIETVESFCKHTGYSRRGEGALIYVDETQTHFVEFCIPSNVTIPPSNKAGDRVPRAQ